MVSFWVYDVAFLVLFSIWVVWFLRTRKKNLNREGWMFLYRTQFGVRAIDYIGKRYTRLLHGLKYIIVSVGFVLMAAMVWILGQSALIYLLHAKEITEKIAAPPIAPLIPYFPKLFGMESYFPPFYFTYFIIALAIVAIVHEFSHGIFMKLFKVKIKSTGVVFLGPILGAFVEQDDKSFQKKKKFDQMVVLAAGVFANVVFALIFYGIYVGFFFTSFAPAGYIFNSYALDAVPLENITGLNITGNLIRVDTLNGTYYLDEVLAAQLNNTNGEYLVAYLEAPAILAGMKGILIQADDVKITGQDKLREFLENKDPGERVIFKTQDTEGVKEYNILLGSRPEDPTKAYLGIGHNEAQPRGVIQNSLKWFMNFKDSSTYYQPKWDGDFVYFLYHLFWWIMIINLLVALFNMLPVGILDGGRFFMLAMWGLTGSENFGKKMYRAAGWLILLIIILMMVFWLFGII